MERRRTPGQRAGLTHARVLAAANALLAEQGVDALTMRAVAQRLAVAPNTLYSHVANKTALIDDVLDGVLATVQTPADDLPDPAAALRQLMTSSHEVLVAHPDLVPLFVIRQGARGPNAQHLGEVVLELLGQAGVTGSAAREALRVLIIYTIGFAAFAGRSPVGAAQERPLSTAEIGRNFDSGLRWLVAGIIQDRAGAAAP